MIVEPSIFASAKITNPFPVENRIAKTNKVVARIILLTEDCLGSRLRCGKDSLPNMKKGRPHNAESVKKGRLTPWFVKYQTGIKVNGIAR